MMKELTGLILLILISSLLAPAQPEMILVEGGEFVMGCTPEQGGQCYTEEYPAHAVKVKSFYIGKYEVTQSQWDEVMYDNPGANEECGLNCPIEQINWYSVIVFCNELTLYYMSGSDRVYYRDEALTQPWTISNYNGNGYAEEHAVYWNNSKNGYRLPTEAEWEFAARGGNQSQGYKYAGSNSVGEVAWYTSGRGGPPVIIETLIPERKMDSNDLPLTQFRTSVVYKTKAVGTKAPNELNIYDMSGNVSEWVWDWWDNYSEHHICDPLGPEFGNYRIIRGGSAYSSATTCRVSYRSTSIPVNSHHSRGFRIAQYH